MALDCVIDGRQFACYEAIIALYWFSAEHHGGQSSDLYRLYCALSAIYTPAWGENGPEPDSVNELIYNDLERLYKFGA
jgi:hypothetical protein